MSEKMWARIKECNREELNEMLTYVERIRVAFRTEPFFFAAFLDIMGQFKENNWNVEELVGAINRLFEGFPRFIEGFRVFLPRGYNIKSNPDGTADLTIPSYTVEGVMKGPFRVKIYPHSKGLPPLYANNATEEQSLEADPGVAATESESPSDNSTQPSRTDKQSANSASNDKMDSTNPSGSFQSPGSAQGTSDGEASERTVHSPPMTDQVLKAEDAHKFLYHLKTIFAHQPQVFSRFLDIMRSYLVLGINTGDLIAYVHNLFRGYPDVMDAFHMFLPPNYRVIMSRPRYERDPSPRRNTQQTFSTARTTQPPTSAKPTESTNPLQPSVNLTPLFSPVHPQPMDPTEFSSTVLKSNNEKETSGPIQQPGGANGPSTPVQQLADPSGPSTSVQQQTDPSKPPIFAEQLGDQIVPSNPSQPLLGHNETSSSVKKLSDQTGTASSVKQLSDQTGISSLAQQLTDSTGTSVPDQQLADSTGTFVPDQQLTDSTETFVHDEQI